MKTRNRHGELWHCTDCAKSYKTERGYNTHQATEHGAELPPPQPIHRQSSLRPADALCGIRIPKATTGMTGTNANSLTTCEDCLAAIAQKASRKVAREPRPSFVETMVLDAPPTRVHASELPLLIALAHERDQVEQKIRSTVRAMRELGTPWSEIGSNLGVTKQAAQQRYGR